GAPVAPSRRVVSRVASAGSAHRLPGGRAASGSGPVSIRRAAPGRHARAGERDQRARGALAPVAEEILQQPAALLLLHPSDYLHSMIQAWVEVIGGVEEEECGRLLQDFFRDRR